MKYCMNCGAQLDDFATYCNCCGANPDGGGGSSYPGYGPRPAGRAQGAPVRESSTVTLIKVFLIIGCIVEGAAILPLAWCIPITVSIFRSLRSGRPIGTGMKVCALLLVSLVAGIVLLCMNDQEAYGGGYY